MKKLLYIFSFILLFISANAQVRVIEKPNPPKLVYDKADVLSPDQERLLEDYLVALDDSTSNQIAIVLVKTLDGGVIEEVANETFRSWGIGSAKRNNGILILAAIDDRDIRIEVGYGLEGAIPDAIAGTIIRKDIAPRFKEEDYYHGLVKAVENLGKAAAGEYREPRERKTDNVVGGKSILKFIIIMIIIIFLIGRGGGGRGRRRGNVMTRRGSDWLGPMILGSMLGGRGGGGFGGGGFGGGGFGGFGGGSSGGGGASGSW